MLDGDCYSPLKVFHHRDRIDELREEGHTRPIHVQIVPTNHCNQRCNFCAYRSHGYSSSEDFHQQSQIPADVLWRLVDGCQVLGVRAVEITGGGEPTVRPDFAELCQRLQVAKLHYAAVTNGVLAVGSTLAALQGAAWVRFSLDAAEDATYSAIRSARPGTLAQVRENVRCLCAARGRPVVGIGFVVTRDNWREILQAARHAKEDGADNFRISAVFQNEGVDYFRPFYRDAVDLCREAVLLQDGSFRVFNLFGERLEDLRQCNPSRTFCGIQHLVTYVGADCNVYRCCVLAYNQRGLLGSIKEQSFEDLWQSSELRHRLQQFDARECPRCMFNRKNDVIRYALAKHPTHVDFL